MEKNLSSVDPGFVAIFVPTVSPKKALMPTDVVILLVGSRAETLTRIDEWRVIRRRQMKAIGGAFMILLGIVTYYWVFIK